MLIVRDEAEVEKRTAKFKEALIPWIEDFDGLWAKQQQELLAMYDKLKAVDLDEASNVDLIRHLWDMISTNRRMWEIHFLGMNVSYAAFLLLEDLGDVRLHDRVRADGWQPHAEGVSVHDLYTQALRFLVRVQAPGDPAFPMVRGQWRKTGSCGCNDLRGSGKWRSFAQNILPNWDIWLPHIRC